jgi:hypothetical protein
MPEVPTDPKGFSLRRWSQRKHAAAGGGADPATVPATGPDAPRVVAKDDANGRSTADGPATDPVGAGIAGPTPASADRPMSTATAGSEPVTLPALDTLTIDSDYTPFMQPGVDDAVKRGALKKLFADPRFNVMDGLDVYIDDYSKPDPIDPAIVRTLVQARYIFNPPATRVNAQGHVEDVPDEPVADEANANSDAPSAPADGASLAEAAVMQALPPAADAIAAETAVQAAAKPGEPAEPPPVRDRS